MRSVATASIQSTGKHYEHRVRAGSHALIADEPRERGGQDEGTAPFDYLLTALGSCTAMTLQMYAERKGWVLGDVGVDLAFFVDGVGHTRITRTLKSTADLSDEQWTRLLEIAEKTPVTLVVRDGTTIATIRGI